MEDWRCSCAEELWRRAASEIEFFSASRKVRVRLSIQPPLRHPRLAYKYDCHLTNPVSENNRCDLVHHSIISVEGWLRRNR